MDESPVEGMADVDRAGCDWLKYGADFACGHSKQCAVGTCCFAAKFDDCADYGIAIISGYGCTSQGRKFSQHNPVAAAAINWSAGTDLFANG